ncbi:MAG: V-type ATP synthase subunit I [candidate division WOR-3 bacterium]
MPQKELKKVSFVIYEEDKEAFLRELQEKEIFHISDLRSSSLAEKFPDLIPEERFKDGEAEELIKKLEKILDLLKPYVNEEKGLLGQFIDLKISVSTEEYKRVVESFNLKEIDEIYNWGEELYHLKNKLVELTDKLNFYEEWKALKIKLSDLEVLKNVTLKIYKLSVEEEELKEKIKELPVDFYTIFEKEKKKGMIFLIYKGFEEDFRRILADYQVEEVNFKGEKEEPEEIVSKCREEIEKINEKISEVSEKIKKKGNEYKKYIILYDYFLFRLKRAEVLNKSLGTKKVLILEGWVEKENQAILQSLANSYEGVELTWVEPEKGESIPVKLKNNPLSSPYEAVVRLYALPKKEEIDPTPFVALFFALFFGFCMTDAAYGVILIAACFYLMPRLPEGRKYLWIFIGGGILTVFAGAITGSWFGSNIEMAFPELSWFKNFREKFMIFDPFSNPLDFLKLSLVFGVIQIFTGLVISIIEKIKRGKFYNAFTNEISWILFFLLLGLYMLADLRILRPFLFIPIFVIFLFSGESKSWIIKIAKGGFTVFNGLISFLGNVLSYSRIMALGLVTAGLAMSINILAKIVRDLIPGVGILFAIILFIFGHLLSIGINTLSSFVHTMRLQFAEFFSYFYEGGGEPFEPFGLVGKYIRIEKRRF